MLYKYKIQIENNTNYSKQLKAIITGGPLPVHSFNELCTTNENVECSVNVLLIAEGKLSLTSKWLRGACVGAKPQNCEISDLDSTHDNFI